MVLLVQHDCITWRMRVLAPLEWTLEICMGELVQFTKLTPGLNSCASKPLECASPWYETPCRSTSSSTSSCFWLEYGKEASRGAQHALFVVLAPEVVLDSLGSIGRTMRTTALLTRGILRWLSICRSLRAVYVQSSLKARRRERKRLFRMPSSTKTDTFGA